MPYEEQFTFSVVPPFRLDLTVWALRRRQKNLIDRWDGEEYTRVLVIHEHVFQIAVEQKTRAELSVTVKSDEEVSGKQHAITVMLKKMFGTDKNLEQFYLVAEKDRYLQQLVKKFLGVKPPRFASVYEAIINAIACQQVTLDLGIALLNKLAEKYGKKFDDKDATQYAFPEAEVLAGVSEQDIKNVGFSHQKARTIIAVSKLFTNDRELFEDGEATSNQEIITRLMEIKGIGRWSAEYVLLRGLGRIGTFPGDDVGAQKNLMLLMNLPKYPTYDEIKNLTKPWEPYAGFVYFHLLLDKLQKKNFI